MKKIFTFIILFLVFSGIYAETVEPGNTTAGKPSISGRLKDASNGEELIGATVFVKELKTGTTTNIYGFYSVSLPAGNYTLVYSYVGYETIEMKIDLKASKTIDIELKTQAKTMQEVTITDKRANDNVVKNEMSSFKMNVETIKKVPALMGEVDIIKVIQLLPGVQTTAEGSNGYSVRGGGTDQNLILLDEAAVYNSSHLMGFFSVFNNDAIKDVKLYKGDIPSEFGGRLSSLLDIRQKEGNSKKFTGTGGIGTISSRLTLEGPLVKDKCSFLIAGRRSYADLFFPLSSKENIKNSTLYFYDVNLKLNYTFNNKNRIFFSHYNGRDVLKIGRETPFKMNWGNKTYTLRWNHIFGDKLFSNVTLLSSQYDYQLAVESDLTGFQWTSKLTDYTVKADLGYFLNKENTIKFGGYGSYHIFEPGKVKGTSSKSIFNVIEVPKSNALDYGLYVANEQKIGGLLTLGYGLRYSIFQNIGKGSLYKLNDKNEVEELLEYGKGKIYNTYQNLEPRISATYSLNEVSSLKASYSHTVQYVQLASSSTVGTPVDFWLPSSPNIKPQKADQWALGYFRNFFKNTIETSVEVYYKDMKNQVDFKEFAQLFINPKIDAELRFGKARAYGAEFLVRKQTGKINGWVSYTYSKALRKINGINNNKEYNASYDKPHNLSFVLNYDISKRVSISGTWVYSTGAAATFPTGKTTFENTTVPTFSERNGYRLHDYHRLDLGLTINSKEKPGKKFHGSWNFSIYNAYNRHNTFSIDFRKNKETQETEAWRTYLFPMIPSVTYNFKF